MPGSSKSIRINGRRFALPADLEPEVILGGLVVTESLQNGDGKSVPKKKTVQGAVMGLTPRLDLSNGDFDALEDFAELDSFSWVYDGPDASYSGTGYMVTGDQGIKMNQSTGLTEAFDLIDRTGNRLVKS